jgi:hypothetical protein
MIRTRWRFGSNRRFVATIECERWFPNAGFLPQIAQTLLIAGGSVPQGGFHQAKVVPPG